MTALGRRQVRGDPGQAHGTVGKPRVSALGQSSCSASAARGCPAPGQASVGTVPYTGPALRQFCCPRVLHPCLCLYPIRAPRPVPAHCIPADAGPHWRPSHPGSWELQQMCWVLCVLPFAALYLSPRPSSFPPTLLPHSACLAPGECGHQSWLRPRAELGSRDAVCCRR